MKASSTCQKQGGKVTTALDSSPGTYASGRIQPAAPGSAREEAQIPTSPGRGAEPRRTCLLGGLQTRKSAFCPRMEPSRPGLSSQRPKSVR